MHPKEVLTKFLKLFVSDTRQAIVSYILVVLIVAGGGLLAISKTALDFSIQIITTPTPLWVTISLVLLSCLYTYLRVRQVPSKADLPYRIEYIALGPVKWKAKIHRPDYFKVDEIPVCKKHDLPLIHESSAYYCPEEYNCHVRYKLLRVRSILFDFCL